MMDELIDWLNANRISYSRIDNDVVEIEGFGKMFLANLDSVESIFRGKDDDIQFNLMETPQVLMDEEIFHVAFKFGNNWYYYDLRQEFKFNILKYVGKREVSQKTTPFVNLGMHSPYELLNGSGGVDQWVKKALYLGHTALGMCDYNTMAGTLNLQKECKNAGIKHIFGYSFSLGHYEEKVGMKIYALNQKGLQNMLRVQKEIMVDSENQTLSLSLLLSHGEGNVLVLGKKSAFWIDANRFAIDELKKVFDAVYFQVDLSEYKAERIDVEILNNAQSFFSKFYHAETDTFYIEPILLCDSYYLDQDDAINKILLNKIATRAAHEQSRDQYLKDVDEHFNTVSSLFDGESFDIDKLFERMCAHTVDIAEKASAAYEIGRNFMPQYDMLPEEKEKYGDRRNMFLQLLEDGFKKLVPAGKEKEYRERLDYEVYVLESTNNLDYMLVQYDTVNWAGKNDILVGCGRGSAGGCLVLYLLGITLVDPIKYDLIFERFLLPERAGLEPSSVTKIAENIDSKEFVEIEMSGKKYKFDIDAQFLVKRGDETVQVFADELSAGDDIVFDNRDLIWNL